MFVRARFETTTIFTKRTLSGWWLGTFFIFPIYWEQSSQLTNIFQRDWNHQPAIGLDICDMQQICPFGQIPGSDASVCRRHFSAHHQPSDGDMIWSDMLRAGSMDDCGSTATFLGTSSVWSKAGGFHSETNVFQLGNIVSSGLFWVGWLFHTTAKRIVFLIYSIIQHCQLMSSSSFKTTIPVKWRTNIRSLVSPC